MPRLDADSINSKQLSTDNRNWPGRLWISSLTFFPSAINRGWMRSSVDSCVSATLLRIDAVRLSLLGLCFISFFFCLIRRFSFRNRIVSMTTPGVTSAYTFHPQPQPGKHAPFFNRLNHILRAGGDISAFASEIGRNSTLINSNRPYEYLLDHSTQFIDT